MASRPNQSMLFLASSGPAVLARLPRDVDYTFIKMIFLAVPPPLTTLLWAAQEVDDPTWAAFRGKTYRAIDRALSKREAALVQLAPEARASARHELSGLRHEWVLQVLGETTELDADGPSKWISIHHRDPARFRPELGSSKTGPALHIVVGRGSGLSAEPVEHRIVPSELAPWGDPSIAWFDPDKVDRVLSELIQTHFADVLDRRSGPRWRTRRPPVGWPVITQRLIPALYDYLRPYYPVRGYTDQHQMGPAGHYPVRLRRDIVDILCLERPDLAHELTVERVTAAIQRHLATAPPDRLMGDDLLRAYRETKLMS